MDRPWIYDPVPARPRDAYRAVPVPSASSTWSWRPWRTPWVVDLRFPARNACPMVAATWGDPRSFFMSSKRSDRPGGRDGGAGREALSGA